MSITFQGFTFRKTEFVLEKSEEEFLLRKEGFTYKKTGIANLKIHKNRIYRRKKGDDKNRKKKDFFQPVYLASFGPLSQLLVKSTYINVLSALKWQTSLNSSLNGKISSRFGENDNF